MPPFLRFERHSPPYVAGDVGEFDPDTVRRYVAEGTGVEVVRDAQGNFSAPSAAPEPAAATARRTRGAGNGGEG